MNLIYEPRMYKIKPWIDDVADVFPDPFLILTGDTLGPPSGETLVAPFWVLICGT